MSQGGLFDSWVAHPTAHPTLPGLSVSVESLSGLAQFGPSELHARSGHGLFDPLLVQDGVRLQRIQVHPGVEQGLEHMLWKARTR